MKVLKEGFKMVVQIQIFLQLTYPHHNNYSFALMEANLLQFKLQIAKLNFNEM